MKTDIQRLLEMLEKVIQAFQETMDLEYGPTEVAEIEEAKLLIKEIEEKES